MKDENRFGYSPEEYKRFTLHAYNFLFMFSVLYCCIYCIRTNLSNVGPVLIESLGWTKADLGILTSVFFWTYGCGQLINGRLCEIIGARKFLYFSIIGSIAANFIFSTQTSLLIMAIIWGLNGYIQSMAWPSGMSLLAKWWPGDKRGFATGFAFGFTGFGQVATTLSVVLGLSYFSSLGWKSAFIIPATFPLIMLIIFTIFVKASPENIGLKEYVEDNPEKAKAEQELTALIKSHGKLYPWLHMLSNKKFVVWLFVAFLQGLIRYGLVTWIPLYYVENFGVDVTSGLLQSLALPVGMGIGSLIVPWLTDRYCPNNRIAAAAVSGFVATVCIIGFAFLNPTNAGHLVLITLCLFIGGFAIYAVTGCVWAFATDAGGRLFSGTCIGMMDFCQYLGAGIQAVLYGFLIDAIGWNMIFMSVAGFCAIVGTIGIINSRHHP